jgi:NADH dehydrogenase [ubiquinone] 1 alpha subcomplex assembly factor 1
VRIFHGGSCCLKFPSTNRLWPGFGVIYCAMKYLLLLGLMCTAISHAEEEALAKDKLIQFDGSESEPKWLAENDGVMGGVSKGGPELKDGSLHFSGVLSLENDGGFSSAQADMKYDFSGKSGIVVRVKGDGRTYQFRLATDARYRGSEISYWAEFETKKGEWVEVKIPFGEFSPSHHGRQLDGPPLDVSKIEQVRFLIGDGKAGPFSMEVDWVDVE